MSSPSPSSSSCCGGSRTIKLFCPALSKLVPFVALEDHGLDMGTIAQTFGLDPSTLRLNGHFLSRGANLISSVTWNSLLSFFAARGFSTGSSDRDAVVVDGKPCAQDPGWHDSSSSANTKTRTIEDDNVGIKRKRRLEDANLLEKRKRENSKSVCNATVNTGNTNPRTVEDDSIIKQKSGSDDVNLLRKRRMDQCESGKLVNLSNVVPTITQFTCSSISRNLKRPREDDLVLSAATPKRRWF
eukprot:TRINITY_DN27287_c0_g1_i2.p1 TRINITY_DN27287_c0_g1~~TRINITY_DN27287_c0_g1_i2.p1  ORF type:complete len:242 (-),score=45.32 TRINITY_DN27287_c0_g1_i2:202-927(-)